MVFKLVVIVATCAVAVQCHLHHLLHLLHHRHHHLPIPYMGNPGYATMGMIPGMMGFSEEDSKPIPSEIPPAAIDQNIGQPGQGISGFKQPEDEGTKKEDLNLEQRQVRQATLDAIEDKIASLRPYDDQMLSIPEPESDIGPQFDSHSRDIFRL